MATSAVRVTVDPTGLEPGVMVQADVTFDPVEAGADPEVVSVQYTPPAVAPPVPSYGWSIG